MSEEVSAAISESIAGLEGSDASAAAAPAPSVEPSATPAAASPMPGVPAPPAPAPAPPGPTNAPALTPKAIPEGDLAPAGDRSKRFIPLDRHESTLQTAREQHQAEIRQLREQTDAQLLEARQQAQLLQLAESDPDRFLDALAQADPRYAQRIAGRTGPGGNGHGGNGNGRAPAAGGMPGPDAQLPDGSVGYSPDGLKALLDWHAGQVQAQMEQRYAPVLHDHETRAAIQAAEGRVREKVTHALQWPGFADAQADIAAALRADRTLDLHGAYMRVVIPKLQANRDTMRAELLAEIQGKPLKVSHTAPHGAAPAVASSDDLQSIIRASIANIQR
jgi:hypothetical protein